MTGLGSNTNPFMAVRLVLLGRIVSNPPSFAEVPPVKNIPPSLLDTPPLYRWGGGEKLLAPPPEECFCRFLQLSSVVKALVSYLALLRFLLCLVEARILYWRVCPDASRYS